MDIPMDLTEVSARVQEKRQIFEEYNFGPLKDDALKTFYDLAQEYETIENFYRVTVSVLKEFLDLDSRLYLVCCEGRLDLVCDSLRGLYPDKTPPPPHIHLANKPYSADGGLILPIRGNLLLVNQLPFYAKDQIIGMLELYPADRISAADRFFLEKYANRLGYNLHVKIVARQNIQHIRLYQQPGGRYRTQCDHPQYQPQPLPAAFAAQDQELERTGVRLHHQKRPVSQADGCQGRLPGPDRRPGE